MGSMTHSDFSNIRSLATLHQICSLIPHSAHFVLEPLSASPKPFAGIFTVQPEVDDADESSAGASHQSLISQLN